MNEYLIIDYTSGSMKYTLVYEKDLWNILDKAKNNELKIAVYKVGDCVLDWS